MQARDIIEEASWQGALSLSEANFGLHDVESIKQNFSPKSAEKILALADGEGIVCWPVHRINGDAGADTTKLSPERLAAMKLGKTSLASAAKQHLNKMIEDELSRKIIEDADYDANRALYDAVSKIKLAGRVGIAKEALERGADPNDGFEGSSSPLTWCTYGHEDPQWMRDNSKEAAEDLEIARLLIQYGADLSILEEWQLAALKLDRKDLVKTAKRILGKKVVEDESPSLGELLINAAEVGDHEGVVACLKYGADVHWNHDKAICRAVQNGWPECVKILLDHGANPNAHGGWPIWFSASNCPTEEGNVKTRHQAVAKLLVRAGADVSKVHEQWIEDLGLTRDDFRAGAKALLGSKKVVEAIVVEDSAANRRLRAAVYETGNLSAMIRALYDGADANMSQGRVFLTALENASDAWREGEDAFALDVDEYDDYNDYLKLRQLTDEQLTCEVARAFLEHGARLDTKHGRNAVEFAAKSGYPELLKLLIRYGASVYPFDDQFGWADPLEFAVDNGNWDCARILVAHGAAIPDDLVADAEQDGVDLYKKLGLTHNDLRSGAKALLSKARTAVESLVFEEGMIDPTLPGSEWKPGDLFKNTHEGKLGEGGKVVTKKLYSETPGDCIPVLRVWGDGEVTYDIDFLEDMVHATYKDFTPEQLVALGVTRDEYRGKAKQILAQEAMLDTNSPENKWKAGDLFKASRGLDLRRGVVDSERRPGIQGKPGRYWIPVKALSWHGSSAYYDVEYPEEIDRATYKDFTPEELMVLGVKRDDYRGKAKQILAQEDHDPTVDLFHLLNYNDPDVHGSDHLAAVKAALDAGANPNAVRTSFTPLQKAALFHDDPQWIRENPDIAAEDRAVAKLLLQYGADPLQLSDKQIKDLGLDKNDFKGAAKNLLSRKVVEGQFIDTRHPASKWKEGDLYKSTAGTKRLGRIVHHSKADPVVAKKVSHMEPHQKVLPVEMAWEYGEEGADGQYRLFSEYEFPQHITKADPSDFNEKELRALNLSKKEVKGAAKKILSQESTEDQDFLSLFVTELPSSTWKVDDLFISSGRLAFRYMGKIIDPRHFDSDQRAGILANVKEFELKNNRPIRGKYVAIYSMMANHEGVIPHTVHPEKGYTPVASVRHADPSEFTPDALVKVKAVRRDIRYAAKKMLANESQEEHDTRTEQEKLNDNLWSAIIHNDRVGVKKWIDAGADVNELHAIDTPMGHEIANTMLGAAMHPFYLVPPVAEDDIAHEKLSREIAHMLVAAGADISGLDTEELAWLQLPRSTVKGAAKKMLEDELNDKYDGQALKDNRLFDAMLDLDLEGVKEALRDGADPNCRNGAPILLAAYHPTLPILSVLLHSGADPSVNNSNALANCGVAGSWYDNPEGREALRQDTKRAAEMLIRFGADPTVLTQGELERLNLSKDVIRGAAKKTLTQEAQFNPGDFVKFKKSSPLSSYFVRGVVAPPPSDGYKNNVYFWYVNPMAQGNVVKGRLHANEVIPATINEFTDAQLDALAAAGVLDRGLTRTAAIRRLSTESEDLDVKLVQATGYNYTYETIADLLERGASPRAYDNQALLNALTTAHERQDYSIVKLLLQHGADVSVLTSQDLRKCEMDRAGLRSAAMKALKALT